MYPVSGNKCGANSTVVGSRGASTPAISKILCRDNNAIERVDFVSREDNVDVRADRFVLEESYPSPANYLDRKVFWLLVTAIEKALAEANRCNALRVQKCIYNGLDYIGEFLWTRNPRRSERSMGLKEIDASLFKWCLRARPRPLYPKSWVWSEDEAALLLQRQVRGWLVRKRDDVAEMRQFWKDLAADEAETLNELRQRNLEIGSRIKGNGVGTTRS